MSRTRKIIYAVVMLFALFVVIGGKFPAFGRHFVAGEPPGRVVANLYRMSELERFREEIPVRPPAPEGDPQQADVLTLGDSFFNSTLESPLFAQALAGRTGLKVCNLQSTSFFEPQSYPLSFLESIHYRGDKKRVLILESVELSVPGRGETYNGSFSASGNKLDALAFRVLKNSDVEYFFKNNVVVHPLLKRLKNVRFESFGVVDKSIGAYSRQPGMLFYGRDLDFAAQKRTDAMLDATADKIAELSKTLRERYHLELIYLVIPNKYSVYHDLVRDGYRYDQYIPRLCEKLTQRGVRNVDAYSLYRGSVKPGSPLLYYMSDTHYTPLGKMLLVDACARMLGAKSYRQGADF